MERKDFIEGPYSRHFSIGLEAAREAGRLMLTSHDFEATLSGLEFKAVIDTQVDDTIIGILRENFPDDAILTEEIGFTKIDSKRLWIVDPLDGTTNFLNGSRMYSCLISYTENGIPIMSFSYLPRSDEMLTAISGQGAFLNGKKIAISAQNGPLRRANIALDPGYDPDGTRKVMETYNRLHSKVGTISMLNCNGYTLSLMALGEVSGFIHFASKIWELAGLHIVQESGGTITDFAGNPLELNVQQLKAFPFVASRGIDHEDFLFCGVDEEVS